MAAKAPSKKCFHSSPLKMKLLDYKFQEAFKSGYKQFEPTQP